MRTEMPIPICADDGVDSDNTETDNIKIPSTNPETDLRTERFILIALSLAEAFWPKIGDLASLRSAHINPEPLRMLRKGRKVILNQEVSSRQRLRLPSFARLDSRGRLSLRGSWRSLKSYANFRGSRGPGLRRTCG